MRVLEVLDALHPRHPRGHRRRLHRLLLRAVGGELGRRVDRPRRALRLDDGACLLRGAAAADGEANLLTRARPRAAGAGPPFVPPPGIAAACWRSAACCLTSSCVACACSCWSSVWCSGLSGGSAPRARAWLAMCSASLSCEET